MAKFYYTHIWDIWEYAWYLDHPDMILTVPACSDRAYRIPRLVMPEAMLDRGTSREVHCPKCALLNLSIRQGTTQDPDIWDDLALPPTGEK